ncbi:MAG: hypothetical protein AAGC55_16615 [Myxococcota bacterium]
MRYSLLGVLVVLGGSCLPVRTTECATGRLCPPDTLCSNAGDGCVPVTGGCGDGVIDSELDEQCDDGNVRDDDQCSADCRSDKSCGNGIRDVSTGEVCDDGNRDDSDSCSADCQRRAAITAGARHTCVLLVDGRVRCWGDNSCGQLGLGHREPIGDDEAPSTAADVEVGGTVIQLVAGDAFTCALLDDRRVRCWGDNSKGQLGQGSREMVIEPSEYTTITEGDETVTRLAAGAHHVCAITDTGQVRCWGDNTHGQLGDESNSNRGDDAKEMPPPNVDLGGTTTTAVAAGSAHTCAVSDRSEVRCWGYNEYGQLGYGDQDPRGGGTGEWPLDDNGVSGEDAAITALTLGNNHACVLLASGAVRCWGRGPDGETGHGTHSDFGDESTDQMPPKDTPIVGAADRTEIVELIAGGAHTCAVLASGALHCWGDNDHSQLGLDGMQHDAIGGRPGEMPPDRVPLADQARIIDVALGAAHTCALLESGAIRCWGNNKCGQLGYADTAKCFLSPGPDIDYLPPTVALKQRDRPVRSARKTGLCGVREEPDPCPCQ